MIKSAIPSGEEVGCTVALDVGGHAAHRSECSERRGEHGYIGGEIIESSAVIATRSGGALRGHCCTRLDPLTDAVILLILMSGCSPPSQKTNNLSRFDSIRITMEASSDSGLLDINTRESESKMSTITTAFVYNAPNAAYDFPLSAPYNFDTYNAGMFEGYLPTSNYAGTGMGYCPQQVGVWVQRRAAAMIEDSFRTNWRVESRKSAPDLNVAPPAVAAGVLPVATAAKVKPTTTTKIPATSVARSIARQDKAMQQLFAIAKSRYEQLAKCSGPIPAHVTRVFRPLSETPSKLNTECRNPRVATRRRSILKPDPTVLLAMGCPAPSPKSPRKMTFLCPEA